MSKITLKDNCGQRLKGVREYLKMTQQEFGSGIGLSWFQVRDLESGKKKLTPELAYDIEKKYSIDFRWLLTGGGAMRHQHVTFGFSKEELIALGRRLRKVREKKALTPAEMGGFMDVDEQKYLSYEAGEEEPSQRSLEFLEDSAELDHQWLIYGNGTMEAPDPRFAIALKEIHHNQTLRDIVTLVGAMSEDRQKEILTLVREKALLDRLLNKQAEKEDLDEVFI